MAQDVLVDEFVESGARLLEEVAKAGVEYAVAFWAKKEGHEQWSFYVAVPPSAYAKKPSVQRVINGIARQLIGSVCWVDPLQIRVISAADSTALAAIEVMTPKLPNHQFATQQAAPCRATWYGRVTLGGLDIDPPAYIYPLPQPAPDA